MRKLVLIGLVLIVLGAVGMFVRTIDVNEEVVSVGDASVKVPTEKEYPLYAGIACAGVGVVLVAAGVLRK